MSNHDMLKKLTILRDKLELRRDLEHLQHPTACATITDQSSLPPWSPECNRRKPDKRKPRSIWGRVNV